MLDSETIACCPPRMMHAVGPKKKSKAQKEAERLQAEEEERKAEILRVKREAERVRKEAEDAKRLKEEQVYLCTFYCGIDPCRLYAVFRHVHGLHVILSELYEVVRCFGVCRCFSCVSLYKNFVRVFFSTNTKILKSLKVFWLCIELLGFNVLFPDAWCMQIAERTEELERLAYELQEAQDQVNSIWIENLLQ